MLALSEVAPGRWEGPGWELSVTSDHDRLLVHLPSGSTYSVQGAEVSVNAGLGAGEIVAYLDRPTVFPPGRHEVWLDWPLAISVSVGQGVVARFGRRRALFGSAEDGRVIDAVRSRIIADPPPSGAALRLIVEHEGITDFQLRRVPVLEPTIACYRRGETLVAGHVVVRPLGEGRAESRSVPMAGPDASWEQVQAGVATPQPLGWILEGARRATEFNL